MYLIIYLCFPQLIDGFGSLAGPMVLAGAQLFSCLALWFCCFATRNLRRSTIRRGKLYMKTKCAPRQGRTTCLTSFFRHKHLATNTHKHLHTQTLTDVYKISIRIRLKKQWTKHNRNKFQLSNFLQFVQRKSKKIWIQKRIRNDSLFP